MDLLTPNFRRLGATPEAQRVLDINDKDFDDIVKHFGQRFCHLGFVGASGKPSPVVNRHISTPVTLSQTPQPGASATEIIAHQRSFASKIPPLARGVIIAWAFFNLTSILLSLFGLL